MTLRREREGLLAAVGAWWRALRVTRGELPLTAALGLMLAALAIALAAVGVPRAGLGPSEALALGPGSSGRCSAPDDTDPPVEAGESFNANAATVKAPTGWVIAAICIKAGGHMFGGSGHSGLITSDGMYGGPAPGSDCYAVTGIGTDTVTVTRTGVGPDCQGLNHIDVILRCLPSVGTQCLPERPTG